MNKICLMYRTLLLPMLIFLVAGALAQSTRGISNQPDTSYNNYSAYRNDKPRYPAISLAEEGNNPAVKKETGIAYIEYGPRKMLLDVFQPKENGKGRIAFIMVHGGGWRTGNRTQHYPLVTALAEKNIVCFTPEYRLSTEALFPAAVYDLKAVIRWVRAHADKYGIDTGKIVVAGFSAGGELAAFLGVTGNMPLFEGSAGNIQGSTRVNAVVDIDGTLSFTHPESGEGDDSKSVSAATYWFGYGKKENRGLWDAASPLSYAGSQTPPTLFLNSSVARMHAGREDFITITKEYNIYTEVHGFDDAPHSFPLYHPWFTPMTGYIEGFLQKVFGKN